MLSNFCNRLKLLAKAPAKAELVWRRKNGRQTKASKNRVFLSQERRSTTPVRVSDFPRVIHDLYYELGYPYCAPVGHLCLLFGLH